MGNIVAALASSHAFAVMPHDRWDDARERNRGRYAERHGKIAVVHPNIASETNEDLDLRFGRVQRGLNELRRIIVESRPDVLLIVGDDQNENFTAQNCPQFAIYTAPEAVFHDKFVGEPKTYACDVETSRALLEGAVDAGFDVSICGGFPDNKLLSHAHVEPVRRVLLPEADIPIVPIYVNAIHWPGPSPSRCFAFGEALAKIVRTRLGDKRVAVYASGGLSHFTAGYPWRVYQGGFGYGDIAEDFDRKVIRWMVEGQAEEIKKLTSRDLLDHGDIELRGWIVALAMAGAVPVKMLAYEPLYRGLMGMGVAHWPLRGA